MSKQKRSEDRFEHVCFFLSVIFIAAPMLSVIAGGIIGSFISLILWLFYKGALEGPFICTCILCIGIPVNVILITITYQKGDGRVVSIILILSLLLTFILSKTNEVAIWEWSTLTSGVKTLLIISAWISVEWLGCVLGKMTDYNYEKNQAKIRKPTKVIKELWD